MTWLLICYVLMLLIAIVPRNLRWLRRYRYSWLVAGLLLVNLAALLLRARARRRYGPFSLCLAGVAAVIVGKFVLVSGTPFMTLGLAAIISGSLWSAHGKRAQVEAAGACCCGSRESLASRRS